MDNLSFPGKEIALRPSSNTAAKVIQSNLQATFARGYFRFNELMNTTNGGAVSIVGSGPSLASTYQDLVGDVIACNSAHDFLIEKGIVPKYAMFWDAHPIIAKFAQKPHPGVIYLVASRCHPDLFKCLEKQRVIVFHAMSEESVQEMLERTGRMEPIVQGGSTGVTRASFVAGAIGYREMHWFGVDSCYSGEETHVGGHKSDERMKLKVCGKDFVIAPWMALQAGDFKVIAPILKRSGIDLTVHGTGMIPYLATFEGIKTPDIPIGMKERLWRKVEFVRMLVHGFEKQTSRLNAIWLTGLLGLIWLLRPLVVIRFGSLFVSRLGHLAGNTECYLNERDAGMRPKRSIDIWAPQGAPANTYLYKMFKRVIFTWESRIPSMLCEVAKYLPWWRQHEFSDTNWGRDVHNLMETMPAHLTFTKAEERMGAEDRRRLGIPDGAKWVCLIQRDSQYLNRQEGGCDYSYHDFRDSDIQNYRLAVKALIERGYYVIRMGASQLAAMRFEHPMFIDYAMSGKRTEFMDVYLGAKCEFCITNSTGFDGIPMIFRRPLCFVNEMPFEYISTWMADSLVIWKHHYRNGRRMSVEEIIASGVSRSCHGDDYKNLGITLKENSPEEIRDVALEMADRMEGVSDNSPQKFWDTFPRSVNPANEIRLHGEIRIRVGRKFLRQYETNLAVAA